MYAGQDKVNPGREPPGVVGGDGAAVQDIARR